MESILRKGQMTLIAAIFIVVAMILLKNITGIYGTIEEKRSQETNILFKSIKNVKNEYKIVSGLSMLKGNYTVIDSLHNFSSTIRGEPGTSILYLYLYSNSSGQEYSITLGNFLNERINITVNVTGASSLGNEFGILEDRINSTTLFDFTVTDQMNMTLTYESNGQTIIEEFKVPISILKDTSFLFLDITMETNNYMIRSKDIHNVAWLP